ncbi:6-phospho-alpha-glucosidase [Bacillus thuringiensis]|uniref:family 4 glycosyl hydrolase n=1 Tax=Bacillus thuringiensis TaxID=1428 RepID=UPI001E4C529D|nr:6-phospho-alpha-glucosidase [Bacillus thuringiensis]MCC2544180.1 6-phospho-alpha-glucosidase [Bacillus thuringiensis]MCU4997830.1 6-phospho-alpha-glucosidase [Bacillus cereus]
MPTEKLVLQDIDEEKLEIMGKYIEILFRDEKFPAEVTWTTSHEEAFTNADFVFTQIRTGGLEMRGQDEKVSLAHGLVGQETCGPGGFAFAMRSIHPMIEITNNVVKYAPNAWIINYSNPLPILAEAIRREVPESKSLFICDMPIVQQMAMAATLGYEEKDLTFEYFGLNHFGWFTSIKNKEGEELLPKLREILLKGEDMKLVDFGHLDESWVKTFANIAKGVKAFSDYIPLTYIQYYYFPEAMVKKSDPNYTRANQVMDGRRKRIFAECKAVIEANSIKGFEQSLDAHGDFIVDQAVALVHDTNERFMVNVVNNGIFSNMDDDMVIETFGTIEKDGAKVHNSIEIPPFYRVMMFTQNAYEKLTVDAALEGSYDKALKALTLNATVLSVEKAKEILDAFIEVNKGYFPEYS